MRNQINKSIFLCVIALVVLGTMGISIWLWSTSYDNFVDQTLQWLDRADYRDKVTYDIFTIKRYRFVRLFISGLGVLISALIVIFRYPIYTQYQALGTLLKKYTKSLAITLDGPHTTSRFLKILLLVTTIRMGYYLLQMPLIYDECWTFLNFTRHGPLAAILTYPSTNNHVVVSLSSSILHWLNFSPTLALRLPVLLCGLLCIILCYKLLFRLFGYSLSCIGTTIFSFSVPLNLYMVLARGYTPMTLCYLLVLYEVFIRKKIGLPFILASMVGFYCVPTFIYPFLLISCYCFIEVWRGQHQLRSVTQSLLIITVGVAFLYLPFILSSSLVPALSKNLSHFSINPFDLDHLIEYLSDLFGYLMGTSYAIPLLLAAVVIAIYRSFSRPIWNMPLYVYSGVALLMPIAFVILQKLQIPLRVFSYLMAHVIIVLLYAIKPFNKLSGVPFRYVMMICLGIGMVLSCLYHFHPSIQQLEKENLVLHRVSKDLVNSGARYVYLDYEVMKPILIFEAVANQSEIDIDMAQSNSMDYQAFDQSLDYDAIILSHKSDIDQRAIMREKYWKKTLSEFVLFQKIKGPEH